MVALYTECIGVCRLEGDEESRTHIERVLKDELAHSAAFRSLCEQGRDAKSGGNRS